jgi:putative SOS response-associated peptidase YedK
MITTPANAIVGAVQERMPALLTPASEKIWMSDESDTTALLDVLVPYPDGMDYYPVSPRIHDMHTNAPSLIMPTPPADQFGNLTLFD